MSAAVEQDLLNALLRANEGVALALKNWNVGSRNEARDNLAYAEANLSYFKQTDEKTRFSR